MLNFCELHQKEGTAFHIYFIMQWSIGLGFEVKLNVCGCTEMTNPFTNKRNCHYSWMKN